MENFIIILEIIGTIAFAISGALVAIGANLDLFGVSFLGVVTAIGGGIMRDIILGNTPPLIFNNSKLVLIAITVSILIFIVAYLYRKNYVSFRKKMETFNNFFDALGLAVFTVNGVEVGFSSGVSENVVILVVVGVFTGIGGGMFRDVLAGTAPYVLKKHIYAIASIIGSIVYIVFRRCFTGIEIPSVIAMAVIIIIRMLSTKFKWKLPKINQES